MRRLPIYFLIDVSESMVGEPIQQVEEGLKTIIQALKTDPNAIETVWISIIVFAGKPRTLIPLQEIINFYPPKFPIGSGTSLSNGLGHLMYELRRNIVNTTVEQKGDWKPIIFLFTDGVPTDETRYAIAEWKKNWQKKANLIAVSFGDQSDNELLGELTDNVLYFNNTDESAYKHFFKWVTDSVKTSSLSVEHNLSGFEIANLDGDIISRIDLTKCSTDPLVDSNFVVVVAKCQNSKRTYLIKYKKNVFIQRTGDVGLDYRLVGAFEVGNLYYELSGESTSNCEISTDELIGMPTCPCCGNQFAFGVCTCGKIHCVGNEDISCCPWCGNQAIYGFNEEGFNVNRTQG